MNRFTRVVFAVATLAGAIVPASGGASAAQQPPQPPPVETPPGEPDKPSWGVEPAGPGGLAERTSFVYTLPPGARLVDTVAVTNVDPTPLTVAIYPVDAYNTSADGAFALRNPEDATVGVGGWIRIGVREYTIPPGTRIEVPFELSVPLDGEPGDHAGAVVAANVALEEGGGTDGLDVRLRRRVGARVYVRVEGPLDPALSVTRLAVDAHQALVPYVTGRGRVGVDYTVTNTGNVRMAPTARVELVGPFGLTVHETEAEPLAELLPGGSVDRHADIDGLPPLGRLSLRVIVTADDANARTARTIWAVPWALVAVATLAVGWRWLRRRHRRRRAARGGALAAHPDAHEQVTT